MSRLSYGLQHRTTKAWFGKEGTLHTDPHAEQVRTWTTHERADRYRILTLASFADAWKPTPIPAKAAK